MKKFNIDFRNVSDPAMLGKTKRGHDGFGLSGVEVNKKVKESQTESEVIISPGKKVNTNAEVDLQTTSEKAEDDSQITSEKAVMEFNGEIIIDE